MIILDMGAGDATKNDIEYIKDVIAALPGGVVVKFQLFEDIPGLTPLDPHVFMMAWAFGQKRNIDVTASVFDSASLRILTKITKVPFIKIACNTKWYPLIDEIPEFTPVLVSVDSHIQMMSVATAHFDKTIAYMCCVPNYPATQEEYEREFSADMLATAISDHTIGTKLYRTYRPKLWEKHLDFHGPDQEHSITIEEVHDIA